MKPIPKLLPLTYPFKLIVKLRNYLFDSDLLKSYKSSIFTISVGNISVGGNGKTPFVAYLAKILNEQGFHPVIITRGYASKVRIQPYLVEVSDLASHVGDEPKLLSLVNNVVVSKDRVAGAKYIESNNLGNIIILDDGFQHRWLKRDLNIILERKLNKTEGLLPAGRLREPINAALKRCDIFIAVDTPSEVKFKNNVFDFKVAAYKIIDPSGLQTQTSPNSFKLFCGIGQPKTFENSVRSNTNFEIVSFKEFPDHYVFQEKDLIDLASSKIPLLCTSKDGIKLSNDQKKLYSIYTFVVEYKILEEEKFKALILSYMNKN